MLVGGGNIGAGLARRLEKDYRCVFNYTMISVFWNLFRGIYAREKTHWVIVFADSGCGWWRRVIAGAKSLT
ncbi:hypothetical protein O6A29_01170 [Escherichia coli]|nr:hypothetical protein [Escherichia coli]